jgi:hypothetical protein
VLAPGAPSAFAGRGAEAQHLKASAADGRAVERTTDVLVAVDVSAFVAQKIAAVAAHRTQYPIPADMLPLPLLQELFGQEYFVRVHPSQGAETSHWLGTHTQGKIPRRAIRASRRSKVPQPISLA